jgi:hypothetical protein
MVERIEQRIGSEKYLKSLNARNKESSNRYVEARRQVAEVRGLERVRTWMKYRIWSRDPTIFIPQCPTWA